MQRRGAAQHFAELLYTQIRERQALGEVLGGAATLHAALAQLHDFGDVFFSKEFVEPRPLLQALEQPAGCVLLNRRNRQVGRRVRIAAAGNPQRFPGHDPGTRYGCRGRTADRDPDL